ncbi:MAG: hypothetical protein ACK5WS_02790 [Alphaproteobacteria bacterium]|jgi:hypothetical protein|nr:hypothetical protein [Candidatus Jidaibacter sp.]
MSKKHKTNHLGKLLNDISITLNYIDANVARIMKDLRQCFSVVPGDVQIAYNNLSNFKSRFDIKAAHMLNDLKHNQGFDSIPIELNKFENVLIGIDDLFDSLTYRYKNNLGFSTVANKFHEFFQYFEKLYRKLVGESKNLLKKASWIKSGVKNRMLGSKVNMNRGVHN